MEIGSFIELDFKKGMEYYTGVNATRLNSARAGIYHAARVLKCNTVYVPYYQCNTVRDFLIKKGIEVKYYSIDDQFNPICEINEENTAFMLVNYFGIMPGTRMKELASRYNNVIIDNAQAFFSKPIEGCMNVYSPRKFFGVPDGCYVIGEKAELFVDEYEQDYSSDTSLFLLQRIEYGCEGKVYQARMENEHRIDSSDIKKMSKLTRTILDGIDYKGVIERRQENFKTAREMLDGVNKLDPGKYLDNECVPMIYPLLIENDELLSKLIENKIFQGHWWSYILNEVKKDTYEYWLSRYIIPITIDQRYGREELEYTRNLINDFLNKE